MNRNNMALFGLVAFLVIGLGLTGLWLMGRNAKPATTPDAGVPVPVPVAKVWTAIKDIPPRVAITKNNVNELFTQSEVEGAPAVGAISDPRALIGKVTAKKIEADTVLTSNVVGESLVRVLPANIRIPSEKLRAVAIWVDPMQTAAGLVDAGDRVDVIAAHKLKIKTSDGDTGEVVSGRTIGQDLEVLAVDKSITASMAPTPIPVQPGAPPPPAPAPTPPPQPGQKIMHRVVLACTPDEAERLVAANIMGELHLTIRDGRTRENYRLAEAIEYPTHSVDGITRKRMEAMVQEETENRKLARSDAREKARLMWMRSIQPKMPDPNTMTPMVPVTQEITVVRGTEKTRVLVPR